MALLGRWLDGPQGYSSTWQQQRRLAEAGCMRRCLARCGGLHACLKLIVFLGILLCLNYLSYSLSGVVGDGL